MAKDRFKKNLRHYLQYLGLKTFCTCLRGLPLRWAVGVGSVCIGSTRFVLRKRFERTVYDIQRAFPEKSPAQAREIAAKSWRNMGVIVAEFLKLSSMTPQQFKKHCYIRGIEKLQNAPKNTGGIIHIGHFTNWEAFGLAASVYGFDKAVLAQRVDNPYVDEEINRLRNIFSGKTLYSNHEDKPFFSCMRWLKKKKMLGILFDQNTVAGEIWLPFMGRTAAFSPITALLSIKMQVPVYPVYVSREKSGMLCCTVSDPLFPPAEYSPAHVRAFTKTLVGYYETWLRQNPANWLWAHNRWKREAEGNAYLQAHPEERC